MRPDSKDIKYQKIKSEIGVGLVFVLVAILVMIGLVSLAFNWHFSGVVNSQIEALASAAAHAGASQLCPDQSCWQASREAAIEIINSHTLRTGLAKKQTFSFSASGSGTIWRQNNVEIQIERGRWSSFNGFESFDALNQNDYPGMPFPTAANGVQVRINVDVPVFLNVHAAGNYSMRQNTVAIARPNDPVCAAPFALPLCSLLDDQSNFDFEQVCQGDRYFTSTDRYGSSAAFEYLPGFYYHPDEYGWCHQAPPDPGGSLTGQTEDLLSKMLFQKRIYSEGKDHFGVVGLPNVENIPSEEKIRTVIRSGNGCVNARIGDPFVVKPEGLTEIDSDELVWDRIIGSADLPSDPYHISYSETDFPALIPGGRINSLSASSLFTFPMTPLQRLLMALALEQRQLMGDGVCNSHRYEHTLGHFMFGGDCLVPRTPEPNTCDLNVWQIKVPVVADTAGDASSCGSPDPDVRGEGNWRILGFVDVNIFDNDIGKPPPEPPESCTAPLANIIWGFSQPCNLVRSRVLCGTEFIASSQSIGPNHPMLVAD